ncbi:thioredoxin [Fimbriimonas ginsengisoli]|uniref:thioredoxin n=1 Tax=Fimbriimonas ginsengisoli TaxID=1005039 RepID=UPI00046CC6FC|nr:thioredoxin [Fimbriimonas ginsengisoli]
MSSVIEVKQSEFDQKALQAEGLVLVDFSAPWCGPCRRMEPELEAAAQEFAGKATFLKVNVDESPDVAMRYGVQGIPNLTFLKDGKVVDTVIGAMPKAAIVSRLKKNL